MRLISAAGAARRHACSPVRPVSTQSWSLRICAMTSAIQMPVTISTTVTASPSAFMVMRWRKSSGSSGVALEFFEIGHRRARHVCARNSEPRGRNGRIRPSGFARRWTGHGSIRWLAQQYYHGIPRSARRLDALNSQFVPIAAGRISAISAWCLSHACRAQHVDAWHRGGPIESHGFGPFSPPDDRARRGLRHGAANAVCGIRAGRACGSGRALRRAVLA